MATASYMNNWSVIQIFLHREKKKKKKKTFWKIWKEASVNRTDISTTGEEAP